MGVRLPRLGGLGRLVLCRGPLLLEMGRGRVGGLGLGFSGLEFGVFGLRVFGFSGLRSCVNFLFAAFAFGNRRTR